MLLLENNKCQNVTVVLFVLNLLLCAQGLSFKSIPQTPYLSGLL